MRTIDRLIKSFWGAHSMKSIGARQELNTLYKEGIALFIGIFLFCCGFLFNLTANIIFDLIKGSRMWTIIILVASFVSLLLLIWLMNKYISKPIRKQEEKLERLRLDTHEAVDRVAADISEST